ncbi:MAG: hypothetical protein VXY93_11405, partial [Pseudomonadota bacterium]|nr:hypothetical protein [Pseudomonadota bacterium]
GGTLTYEDVKNVDAVGLITARSGIRVTGGVIEAQAGENKIPSLYSNMGALPSAGTYHGMFAHVHATGRGYFAHAGNWYELVNKEVNGVVGTGTEHYNVGIVTASSFSGDGDFFDLDVDGHTNLDNVSIAGVTTAVGTLRVGTGHTFHDNGNAQIAGITTVSGTDLIVKPPTVSSSRIKLGYNEQMKISVSSANQNVIQSTAAYLQIASNNINLSRQDTNLHMARFLAGQQCKLTYNYIDRIATSGVGATVYGQFDTTNLNIAGVSTFTGNIDANGDLDVDGHTNLDNVSIAGVTSVASLTSGRVVTAGTGGKLQDSNNLTFDGTNLFVSGINVTGGGATSILGADIVTRNLKATGLSTFVGQSEFDGNAKFDSTITAGGSAGTNGQYLKTTGSGVEWATFPT